MQAIQSRLQPIIALAQRFPRALALISFGMGLASFFMVNRQNRSAGIIAGVLLAGWVWLMLENLVTEKIARRFNLDIPPTVLRYITQLIHQESFFFVLPFFLITTTWNSGQPAFIGILALAALVSIIDPLYYQWLASRRLLFMAFHTLALFAVLLTALPVILQLTTTETYAIATATTVVLALPTLFRLLPEGKKWLGFLRLLSMILVLTLTLWVARFWVPPATLWLTDVHVSQSIDSNSKTAVNALSALTESSLHEQGLYAYTAIRAPRGLAEKVYHVWKYNGDEIDRIALKIKGGREEGYRTWTHKTVFPAEVTGHWQVQVVTEAGQLIGVVRFDVIPDDRWSQSTGITLREP